MTGPGSSASSAPPPASPWRGPEQTFGRYRLLERLGEGGMAEVFKAKSFGVEGFEKVLVIKRILPKLAEHPKFVDMFVHEAKLAVRLSHANIVQVFDLGRVDHGSDRRGAEASAARAEAVASTPREPASYFIAMEYVPGLDLSTLLARCRKQKIPVPFGMAVFITAEVAKALDHAHRRRDEQSRPLGIVHRDISPQNILLSWEGEVKVTDFGIAKAKDSIIDEEESDQRPGRVRGKLAYMSPEQSQAQRLDGRSDIFSLGTVLYEMIAGNNPFVAPTQFETLRRVQASEYPPLELLRPDTPRPLIEIVSRMLAKNVDDRFADAGRLHEQLLGFFYATGERFGSNKLAEFLERFHESAAPEITAEAVFSERNAANERTPVEVPSPNQEKTGSRTGTSGFFRLTGGGGDVPITRTAEIGERREVTALVLSFFGEDRDRGQNAEGAATLRARARDVLARYGATVLEEEPSQIVALFGLGDADGRDTEAAVRVALIILRSRTSGLALSAGVHVSRILVDPAGVPIRDERLASLVASAQALARATDGQVAASHLASRIIRSEFSSEELPGAGMTAPEGGRVITSARAPSAVYGRFIGRHDELKHLGDILAAATRRRAQIVTIQGDKGIGKTRMVAEMERRLAKGNYNVGFYVAACPKNGADVPWSGLSALLRVLCGIQEGDDEARILDVLPRLRALGLTSEESATVLAQLGAALAEPGQKPCEDTSATLRAVFARMVQSLCDDRLHVFVFDDAQSIDKATLESMIAIVGRALERDVAPSSLGLRAVFILATRDDPPEALTKLPLHHKLVVGELSDDDSARLISTRVGARVLLPELLAFCRERAGGHPLFLEELIKELTDSGAISVLNGAVRARLEGATAVPRTLRTLIAGRVSRLDPSERAVLQAAAILGEPVLTDVLAALLKQSIAQLTRTMASLFARDFLRILGPAQVTFSSPIHGEIVLDAIPPEARRELHAAAADAFIQVVGEEGGVDQAERIGNHLYEAGDRDRAAGFFASAALHRLRVHQLEPAIRLLARALDLADHAQRSASELSLWLSALAGAVSRVRAAPDLPALATRVLRRIDAAGTPAEKVSARVDIARALGSTNLFEDAYKKLDEALVLAAGDAQQLGEALFVEIEMAGRSGEYARAVRAIEKLESLGPIQSSRALLSISIVRAAAGHTAAALRDLDVAERLDRPDDLMAAAAREKQRVLVHLIALDHRAAADASVRAIDLARTVGVRYDLAATLHNLGDAYFRLGDLQRAYAALSESKEIAAAAGNERLVTLNQMFLAYLDGVSGLPDTDKQLRDLIRYAESRGIVTDARQGRLLLGELLTAKDRREEARRELTQLVEMAEAHHDNAMVVEARAALAKV
ncbi:Serine/threonine protein kinase PrkC, regulator of stationary phase [Minicystis rosea]|nr:Serine/threonine protein kinase PrkC, regulator of stationary phase [Minicystis rosea]